MQNTPSAGIHNTLIREGDAVLLWFEDEQSYLIEVTRGKRASIHCGRPLLVDDWIGKPFGQKVVCEHGSGYLLKPTLEDFMMKASRESGIIYPKDAALLIMKAGITTGSRVIEVGTGSGSLTMALAQTVAPNGHVYTYDRRTDLPKNARRNVARAGLTPFVTFKQRQAMDPFEETGVDAMILDIPQPWDEVEQIRKALRGGGRVVSLNPTFNQIEKMAEALRAGGFILVEARELLEREILARGGKTRPVQRMIGHTEFMLFAVRPLEETPQPGPATGESPPAGDAPAAQDTKKNRR
ncbi:MAG TPA: tRNA (adenine-N1)-methyltransferase [Candidatus Omnitrophota bacterium]|jgi:tRNA (adenine57-N1/adenine58-N1)-methyltransferase|nr:tRNA (adenine-N1)-methyltransferase [Candidatus Omnitrophota bacterium]HQB93659.1 tRNA (adenine-N1)-methyltransferase [Candidatus Omnitrophota bacterium]